MKKTGNLSELSFPVILAELYKARLSGTLSVTSGPYNKKVYIKEGAVIFSASSSRNDRLGEMLLRRKLLKLKDYETVSKEVKPGLRFGTILVNRGLLSPGQLVKTVAEQVKEIVFSLFSLPSGDWKFQDGLSADDEVITLNINTTELLRQGVKRMDTITPLLEIFEHTSSVPRLAKSVDETTSRFQFDETETAIIGQLDGNKSLHVLAELTQLSNFELLKLLWVLLILDLLIVEPGPINDEDQEESPDFAVTGDDLSDLLP